MNKTAIVTGAGRGIGLAIAEALLANGYNVVSGARNISEDMKRLKARYGNRCMILSLDIASEEARKSALNAVADAYGKIDLLVNNAGVAPKVRKDMLEIDEEAFDYVMDINLRGTYFMTQNAVRLMNDRAKIVNIGSVSAETVSVNRAEYCIAKAGVSMLTKLFAVRLAARKISVFEIRPGVIDTDMIQTVKGKYETFAQNGEIPLRKLGAPSDVADMVLALSSGAFDYATGSVIECGGGMHIRTL